jgi:uncharacterized membrane protein
MESMISVSGLYRLFQKVVLIFVISLSLLLIMMIFSGLSIPLQSLSLSSVFVLFISLILVMFIVSFPILMRKEDREEEEEIDKEDDEIYEFVIEEDLRSGTLNDG